MSDLLTSYYSKTKRLKCTDDVSVLILIGRIEREENIFKEEVPNSEKVIREGESVTVPPPLPPTPQLWAGPILFLMRISRVGSRVSAGIIYGRRVFTAKVAHIDR